MHFQIKNVIKGGMVTIEEKKKCKMTCDSFSLENISMGKQNTKELNVYSLLQALGNF